MAISPLGVAGRSWMLVVLVFLLVFTPVKVMVSGARILTQDEGGSTSDVLDVTPEDPEISEASSDPVPTEVVQAADILNEETQTVNKEKLEEEIEKGEDSVGSHTEKLIEIHDDMAARSKHRRIPRAERDNSYYGRFNALSDSYGEFVSDHVEDIGRRVIDGWEEASNYVLRSSGPVTKVKDMQGKEGKEKKRLSKKAQVLAAVLLAVPPVAVALPMLLLCRAYRPGAFSLQRLVQTLLGALALWFVMLCLLQEVLGVEPMGSFQLHQGHSAYVKVQFISIIGYLLVGGMLMLQLFATRFRASAITQTMLFFVVMTHYYESVFQPAVHGEVPEKVLGIPTGATSYGIYAFAFLGMVLLSPGQIVSAADRMEPKTSTE